MPYKSDAQRKYFHANRKKLEAQGVNVSEWDAASKGMKLPKRKKKKYQIGGGDDNSDFFNTLASAAQAQQQQSPEDDLDPNNYLLDPNKGFGETEDQPDYADLQSQIEDLKAQIQSQSERNYDPLFNSNHEDDEFLSMLFSDQDQKNPILFNNNYESNSNEPVDEKEVEAYNFFTQEKGLPEHVAAGIVGNLKNESNLNTNAVGDNGIAKGIAQWHPDRLQALKRKGHDLSSFKGQLEAVYDELTTSETDAFKSLLQTSSPEQAAVVFDRKFERSAGLSTQKRANSAASLLKKVKGKYQTGGIAQTAEQQYIGLNDENFDSMLFPKIGTNTFRGLDSGNPVLLQDQTGRKKILKGKYHTAKMQGNVFEKRL